LGHYIGLEAILDQLRDSFPIQTLCASLPDFSCYKFSGVLARAQSS
jgi:hypothetical protein